MTSATQVAPRLGAVADFASPSGWERYRWGPFAVALTALCFIAARRRPAPAA